MKLECLSICSLPLLCFSCYVELRNVTNQFLFINILMHSYAFLCILMHSYAFLCDRTPKLGVVPILCIRNIMQLCFKFYYALLYKIKNSNPYIAPFMINLMYQKTKELRNYTHKQCFCATR